MYVEELDPKAVGAAIAYIRSKKGISQEVLSGLAGIGRTHLSAIERGERRPTLETLFCISEALCISAGTIVSAIEDRIKNTSDSSEKSS